MSGISPVSWQQECALSHLRNDAKELLRLHKYHGDLTPDWLDHMKESVALLQRIIDGHGQQPKNLLPELQVGVSGKQKLTKLALDVHSPQEA